MSNHRLSDKDAGPSLHTLRLLPLLLIGCLLLALPLSAQGNDRPGSLGFKGAAFPIAEENGPVVVKVKRTGGNTGVVSVAYTTTPGSAEEGIDFEATSGILEWADGDRSDKTFAVVIIDDAESEPQETFGVVLSDPTGGAALKPPSTAVVRIKPSDRSDDGEDDDDEPTAGVIKLTRELFTSFESSGSAEFTVERDDGVVGEVSVEYMTLDGSAIDGEDYIATSGVLIWGDGEDGEKSVSLDVIDDLDPEDTETISIILTNATGGATLGRRDTATLQIIDDDGGVAGCAADAETLCLGDGRFQVTGIWSDFEGNSGPFNMVQGTDDSGFAWFFDEDNLEVLIKVLNGCPINQHYWVFFAATTNVGFTIEVQDLVAGASRTYTNPLGVSPETTTDTTAFLTCDL